MARAGGAAPAEAVAGTNAAPLPAGTPPALWEAAIAPATGFSVASVPARTSSLLLLRPRFFSFFAFFSDLAFLELSSALPASTAAPALPPRPARRVTFVVSRPARLVSDPVERSQLSKGLADGRPRVAVAGCSTPWPPWLAPPDAFAVPTAGEVRAGEGAEEDGGAGAPPAGETLEPKEGRLLEDAGRAASARAIASRFSSV